MKKKTVLMVYVFLCTMIIFKKVTYAYLDPSAMTYLIQVTAAIFISIGSVIGIFFYKIRRFLKNRLKNNKEENKDLEETCQK